MRDLFIAILNMSISASFVAIVVMLLRLPLKRTPKVFSYMLWAVVLFRLICPLSFESAFSLLAVKPDAVPQDIVYAQNPAIESGVGFMDDAVNGAIQNSIPHVRPESSVNPMGIVVDIVAIVWLAGILILIGYSVVSYIRLKKKLDAATLVEAGVYETDRVSIPFVIGFLHPKIYLPLALAAEERDYILRHEQTHIRRRDYLIKPLGFLALVLHWFNPLVWLSYRLMCRDMEMSCDERVIGQYGEDIRAKYSGSLLSLSMRQSGLLAPLAFGEPDAKSRIKNVLNYKKPAFWISAVAVLVLVVAGFCLLANPVKGGDNLETDYHALTKEEYEDLQAQKSRFEAMTNEEKQIAREGGTVSCVNFVHLWWEESIEMSFIRHVGEDAFNEWINEPRDSRDCTNIYSFADEFGLDFSTLKSIIIENHLEDIYPLDRLESRYNYFHSESYAGAYPERSERMAILFPISDAEKTEHNARVYEIEPFGLSFARPDGWTLSERGSVRIFEDDLVALSGMWSVLDIFGADGELIGAVGYNIYEPYEGAEEDPRAIYGQIALGNNYHFDVRDSYTVVNEADYGTTAVCNVYYIQNGLEKNNKGIVSYNRDFHVYIAMEFASDKITDTQVMDIAESILITRDVNQQPTESEEPQYDFFAVPEMTAEQQTYHDGYLRKLIPNGLLLRDWSGQNHPIRDYETNSYLILAFEDFIGYEEMQRLFDEYNDNFPAIVIEGVLLEHFPFTVEQLHEIMSYNYRADTNTYYYEGGRGGGPIEAAVVGIRTQGDFVYLDYEFYNGYSGLDEIPDTYLYKTPGVLTLQRKADGNYLYYAVDVGEQEEAPLKTQAN